jgi:hypothetical protein
MPRDGKEYWYVYINRIAKQDWKAGYAAGIQFYEQVLCQLDLQLRSGLVCGVKQVLGHFELFFWRADKGIERKACEEK